MPEDVVVEVGLLLEAGFDAFFGEEDDDGK
jgi:hypothetical protein